MKKGEGKRRRNNQILFCYGFRFRHPTDIIELEDEVEKNTGAIIQAVDKNFVLNREHAMFILTQCLEAYDRGIFIARKSKYDIILHLLCTQKIEKALADGGIKKDYKDCVILGYCGKRELQILKECIMSYGTFDERILEPSGDKEKFLTGYHKINSEEQKNYDLLQLLCERSATSVIRYYKSKA